MPTTIELPDDSACIIVHADMSSELFLTDESDDDAIVPSNVLFIAACGAVLARTGEADRLIESMFGDLDQAEEGDESLSH